MVHIPRTNYSYIFLLLKYLIYFKKNWFFSFKTWAIVCYILKCSYLFVYHNRISTRTCFSVLKSRQKFLAKITWKLVTGQDFFCQWNYTPMTHVVENFPMPLPLGLKTMQEMSYLRSPIFNAKTPHIKSPNINSKGQL